MTRPARHWYAARCQNCGNAYDGPPLPDGVAPCAPEMARLDV